MGRSRFSVYRSATRNRGCAAYRIPVYSSGWNRYCHVPSGACIHGASDGFRGNQHSNLVSGQNDHLPALLKTRERIAEETHTSDGYVKRAGTYAKGVDAAEDVLPGIKDELLSGSIKPSEADVAAVAKAAPDERRQLAEGLRITKPKAPARSSPAATTASRAVRQDLKEIREIYADMNEASSPVSEDSVLETLHGTGSFQDHRPQADQSRSG